MEKEFKSLSERITGYDEIEVQYIKEFIEKFLLEFGTATLYNKDEIKSILNELAGEKLI